MDATVTLVGSMLAFVGVLGGALVAYLGKRGENAVAGYSSLTERLQTQLDRLERQLGERDAKLAELQAQRTADQEEITRLRIDNSRLGGTSS